MNKILIIQKSENNKSISTKNFIHVLQIIFIRVNVIKHTYCKIFTCFKETERVDAVKLISSLV